MANVIWGARRGDRVLAVDVPGVRLFGRPSPPHGGVYVIDRVSSLGGASWWRSSNVRDLWAGWTPLDDWEAYRSLYADPGPAFPLRRIAAAARRFGLRVTS